ncbi:MAG: hypothetical protein M3440_15200 [Chloroflexota bacterium]|nr:hypothetical protein [Chloroflexota bacterium]
MYGWYRGERIEIQAQVGALVLVRYIARPRLPRQYLVDSVTREHATYGPLQPWAWLPARDIEQEAWEWLWQ